MVNVMMIRTYSEMCRHHTYADRVEYLKLGGVIGEETFGMDRYLNQQLYHSQDWYKLRDKIITRDLGCNLAIKNMEIMGIIIIHHMNPISPEQIMNHSKYVWNPEYMVCVDKETHDYIHFGKQTINKMPIQRSRNDHCPWLY